MVVMKQSIELKNQKLAWILLIVLALIWGSSFILIKKGLVAFSPGQVGSLRIIFAFLVLLPFGIKHLSKLDKKDWFYLLIVGTFGNFIPYLLFAKAETRLESSLTGILNSLTPVFTMIISMFVFNFKMKPWQIAGLFISLAGSLGISFVNNSGGFGSINYYAFFVVAATFCYGISSSTIKAKLSHIKPVVNASISLLTVGPVAIVYILTTDFTEIVVSNPEALSSLGYLLILGIFGTAIALIFFNKLIYLSSAVFATSVTYLIPVVAVLWGIVDGESIFPLHFAGMILIIFGVYKINKQ